VNSIISILLVVLSALLFVPAFVYFFECMVAALSRPGGRPQPGNTRPAVTVVMPAHNEEGTVGDTVAHVLSQLEENDRLIVIADNCSDETAAEATNAGAMTWERTDPERRGKGYAISFAVDRLSADPPPVVILIDADCRVEEGLIDRIARAAVENERPIQSRYLFVAPAGSGRICQISSFACLVRNYVRPLGLDRLGFPCHLTGSGMAFRWDDLASAPGQAGNIVEDLSLGLELAISGKEPMLCENAIVRSELPIIGGAARAQRKRWEHGQLATLVEFVPRLLREALAQRRPSLFALALDLVVPPLAFLILLNIVMLIPNLTLGLWQGQYLPLGISLSSLGLIGIGTIVAWARYGRDTVDASVLLSTPFYVLWKLPMYLAAIVGKAQKEWLRTDRGSN